MSSALSDGVDKECCMTILHGAEFRLKQFCIVGESFFCCVHPKHIYTA